MTGGGSREGTGPAAGKPRHIPVLLSEVLAALAPTDGETFLDGTFGAGGYTRAILEAAPASRVIAIDRDPSAIAAGAELAAANQGRLMLVEGRFGDLDRIATSAGHRSLDGVVLDIGVSSMQIDEPGRGFSFQSDGPLDMRMGGAGPSAADVVNRLAEKDLAEILWVYGEERRSRRIAAAIVARRAEEPFTRTGDLAGLIERLLGRPPGEARHPATRSFQALRIFVNDELGELARALDAAEHVLAPGGRLAIVTFHSLEDRLVKTFLKERAGRAPGASRHQPAGPAAAPPGFRFVNPQPLHPGKEETDRNPRARSARLRSAIRTDEPPSGASATLLVPRLSAGLDRLPRGER
ncbi:MAG: 16S rRNA (cytosine(1402)-N(4))-methyltransferase RsmH [Geminicoccaceae bacterium]